MDPEQLLTVLESAATALQAQSECMREMAVQIVNIQNRLVELARDMDDLREQAANRPAVCMN